MKIEDVENFTRVQDFTRQILLGRVLSRGVIEINKKGIVNCVSYFDSFFHWKKKDIREDLFDSEWLTEVERDTTVVN